MEIEIVATGLDVPEGPLPHSDGTVFFTEVCGRKLSKVDPAGRKSTVATIAGGPNSAAFGPDGAIYVPDNGGIYVEVENERIIGFGRLDDYAGGFIRRIDPRDGRVETLYAACDGERLIAPNDLIFDAHGGFWFSDSGGHGTGESPTGGVFYALPDGGTIRRVRGGLRMPNGIGLSPDGRTLYLVNSSPAQLLAWDVVAPGMLADGDPRVLATNEDSSFDSLAVEAGGNICIGTIGRGGITVVSPDGGQEHVPLPDATITNIAFGGADMRDAYVTGAGTGRLFKLRWPRPGLVLAHAR